MVIRPLAVVVAHLLALLGPICLELFRASPSTFSIDADGLRLTPGAIDVSPSMLIVVIIVGSVLQLISTSLLVMQLRRARDTAARATRTQLWHLSQLLPAPGAPRTSGFANSIGTPGSTGSDVATRFVGLGSGAGPTARLR